MAAELIAPQKGCNMLNILSLASIYPTGNGIPTGLPDLPTTSIAPEIPQRLGELHTWMSDMHAPTIDQFLGYLETLHPVHGIILMVAGLVYMILGLRLGRLMMSLNLAMIGAVAGGVLAIQFGWKDQAHIAAIGGAITLGVMAFPLLKLACILSSGVVGLILGSTAWTTVTAAMNRPDLASSAWIGGAVLAVVLVLLSLALLRFTITLVTALQGAAIMVCGILALCLQDSSLRETIYNTLRPRPFLLLLPIVGCFIAGACLQYFTKGRPKQSD